jgi:hypothetical protein
MGADVERQLTKYTKENGRTSSVACLPPMFLRGSGKVDINCYFQFHLFLLRFVAWEFIFATYQLLL